MKHFTKILTVLLVLLLTVQLTGIGSAAFVDSSGDYREAHLYDATEIKDTKEKIPVDSYVRIETSYGTLTFKHEFTVDYYKDLLKRYEKMYQSIIPSNDKLKRNKEFYGGVVEGLKVLIYELEHEPANILEDSSKSILEKFIFAAGLELAENNGLDYLHNPYIRALSKLGKWELAKGAGIFYGIVSVIMLTIITLGIFCGDIIWAKICECGSEIKNAFCPPKPTHYLIEDYYTGEISRVPVEELAEHVNDWILNENGESIGEIITHGGEPGIYTVTENGWCIHPLPT